jgi:hypothetical protein
MAGIGASRPFPCFLDDDPGVRPDADAFIVDKAPWFTVTDDLHQYPARIPGQNAPHNFLTGRGSRRHAECLLVVP